MAPAIIRALSRSPVTARFVKSPVAERVRRRAWNGILVISYHRVGHPRGTPFNRSSFSATPEAFDRQIGYLASNFDVIGPSDLDAAVDAARGQFVLVTFDDGYRDNFEHALPILRSHGVTSTFFPVTSFLDEPTAPWWDEIAWMVRSSPRRELPATSRLGSPIAFDDPDREQAVRTLLACYYELPSDESEAYLDELAEATGSGRLDGRTHADEWLTWDMVRALRDAGMAIGGHSVTHPLLSRLPLVRQRAEIEGCLARLRDELGQSVTAFAYPVGLPEAFNEDTRLCLQDAGIKHAFSHYGGYQRSGGPWDPLNIRRTSISRQTSDTRFWVTTASPARFARW